MATEMYAASRLAKAHQKAVERVELKLGGTPDKLQLWVNAAVLGYTEVVAGVRPTRECDALIFASRSKKKEGHRVQGKQCSCQAAQFGNPCWARAAADMLNLIEMPPEYDPFEE
jgi:hypothetical protein